MQNLKIKVNSEAESKEAQELFFELGGKPHGGVTDRCGLVVFANGTVYVDHDYFENHYTRSYDAKEITLPELRDMVVLKRNDKNDRNVVDPEYEDANLYLDSKNDLFVFHIPTQAWKESNLNHEQEVLARLKPIEKKEMKEFLVNHDNKWTLQLLDADTKENSFRVAVPSGADVACKDNDNGSIYFTRLEMGYRDAEIIWQRPTQPEALPFIDDDQDMINSPSHYTQGKVECIDAIESATVGKTGIDAVCVANVIKYLWRYEEKNGVEDIKKAQWYLQKLIENNI